MAISMRKLKERLTQLEHESLRIDALVEHYRLVITDLEAIEGDDPNYSPSNNMRDTMEHILKVEGKPLHYRFIYGKLIDLGIRVNGEDPVRNTGAHLSSDDRFESLGSGTWGLTEWRNNSQNAGEDGIISGNPELMNISSPRRQNEGKRELGEGESVELDSYISNISYPDLPPYDDGDDLPF